MNLSTRQKNVCKDGCDYWRSLLNSTYTIKTYRKSEHIVKFYLYNSELWQRVFTIVSVVKPLWEWSWGQNMSELWII